MHARGKECCGVNCWPDVDGIAAVVVGSGGMESAKEFGEGCYQLVANYC